MTSQNSNQMKSKKQRFWLIAGIIAIFLILPTGIWLGRLEVGEFVARQYCRSHDVRCDLELKALGFDRLEAGGINIQNASETPLSIDSIDISLRWPQLFSPVVTSVEANAPSVEIDARDGKVTIGALKPFLSEGGNGLSGMPDVPPFLIRDGKVSILTDAGRVKGVVNSSGSLQRELQTQFRLQPANLKLGEQILQLRSAEADLVIAQDRVHGSWNVSLGEVRLKRVSGQELALSGTIETPADHTYRAEWAAAAGHISLDEGDVSDLQWNGIAEILLEDLSAPETALIRSVLSDITATAGRYLEHSAGTSKATLDLSALEAEGIQGNFSIEAEDASIDRLLFAESFVLTGDLALASDRLELPAGRLDATASVRGATLATELAQTATGSLSLPEPVDAHSDAFAGSLSELLSAFNAGVEAAGRFDLAEMRFDATVSRPAVVRSPSGQLALAVQPVSEHWLEIDRDNFLLAGRMRYSDGARGLEAKASELNVQQNFKTGQLQVSGAGVVIDPWQVEGRTLSLALSELAYRQTNADSSVMAVGKVGYSGPAFGLELDDVTIDAALQGLATDNVWNIRFAGKDCFDLAFSGVRIADTEIGPGAGEFCAPGGRLYSREQVDGRDVLKGSLSTPKLRLPVTLAGTDAPVILSSPVIDWTLADAFRLALSASEVQAPFEMAPDEKGNQLSGRFASQSLKAGLVTTDQGIRVTANLSKNQFEMKDAPVKARIDALSLSGPITDAGANLSWRADRIRIEDAINPPENALFAPLLTSGQGRMTAEEITYSGGLLAARSTVEIGQIDVTHRFDTASGEASLRGDGLRFEPDGLQFEDLSERLRGLAVNATGQVIPTVSASWTSSDVKAAGQIELQSVSFSTFRLGQVINLSGALNFNDFINFKTPPGQVFTVERLQITPAFGLENGRISLELLGTQGFQLESARWPFVGGELRIEPTRWIFDEPVQNLSVSAEEWELSRLINLFDIKDLDVQGRVSGEFPIEISGANVFLRNAQLSSVEDGLIRYQGALGEQASTADQYAKMAFDALRNFEYEVLAVGADGNLTDEIVVDLALSGHNPNLLEGQVFNLNISLQSKLAELIQSAVMSASGQATSDALVELVKQKQAAEKN